MTDYSGMSKDELLAANQALMQKRADFETANRDEQLALNEALSGAIAEERILAEIKDMPMAEREAMIQVLQTAPPPEPPEEETEEEVITADDVATVESVLGEGEVTDG